ncbi:MAG: glycosyltransferase family 4 protein [Thermoanaerobaculia bacterium]
MSGAPDVVLVGPIPPWRSGIADQTVRLARAITKLGLCPMVLTFHRMYPRVLYPGAADRDEAAYPADLADVRPVLDGANPLSFRAAARLVASLKCPLVLLPWWTAWWASHDLVFLATLGARSPHTVKLLLCHNLVDHEGSLVKRALSRAVFQRADRFVVQNRSSVARLQEVVPGRPVSFIPHPSETRTVSPDRSGARARLGVPEGVPVFLFTGLLRPYKGWDLLLDAFGRVRSFFPDALLVFAGEAWGDARALRDNPAPAGVRLELRYLPADERALWLDACDAVVCPYRNATGSGIAADAMAHARPVIGTRVDGLVDVIEDGETGLLVPAGDRDALSDAMIRFVRDGLGPSLAAGVVAHRARFAPEEHARLVLQAGGIDVARIDGAP